MANVRLYVTGRASNRRRRHPRAIVETSTVSSSALSFQICATIMRMSVLGDALKTLSNAEKRGKRQVLLRPSSKVVIKVLQVMQSHGTY